MAFPETILPIRAQMFINSAWVTVTSRVRLEDDIVITGGQANEQASLSPGTINVTLNNRNGDFSNDYPLSPYFGLVPNNTPFRVGIDTATAFVKIPKFLKNPNGPWAVGRIQTTDKAVLDITGDLDIQAEFEPDEWTLGGAGFHIASKYDNVGNQRSYLLCVTSNGYLRLIWSSSGSDDPVASGLYATSTVIVPRAGRIAVRATIDVNNGAAGRTVTFYTSTSIVGAWTQLGATVIQSGTTSIFAGTATLQLGTCITSASGHLTFDDLGRVLPMAGKIYRFRLYNNIAGTLVADMNATTRTAGDTSWSDGLGTPNTWALTSPVIVESTDWRGYGEISEMPQEWDGTGADIYVPTQASGILRRLTQGGTSLQSSIFRNLRSLVTTSAAVGYWPCEEGSSADAATNAVPSQPSGLISGVSFASDGTFVATEAVASLDADTSYAKFTVLNAPTTDQSFFIFYMKIASAPVGDTEMMNFYTTGTVARLAMYAFATGYGWKAYSKNGTLLSSASALFTGAAPGQWVAFQLRLSKNGTGVDVNLGWFNIVDNAFAGLSATTLASSTMGRITGAMTTSGAAVARMDFAHVILGTTTFDFSSDATFRNSSRAYIGELAITRALRVLGEEGALAYCIGNPLETPAMGAQPISSLTNIIEECVAIDNGLWYEAPDVAAILIRTGRSLSGQGAGVTLSYTSKHLSGSFRPAFDDVLLRNRVTANRSGGGAATYEVRFGKNSINNPPAGVGVYAVPLPFNASSDYQLAQLAGFAALQGTQSERRIPNLETWLQRAVFVASASLTEQMRSLHPGDRVQITGMPFWVGGNYADAMIRGFREVLQNRGHILAYTTSQYGVWDCATYSSTTIDGAGRYDSSSTTLGATVAAGVISLSFSQFDLKGTWSTSGTELPYDVEIAGEHCRVTAMGAVTGSGPWTQAATVTRAINGISKILPVGSVISLTPTYAKRYAL